MKLLKEYSTLDEAINYLTHETGAPVDLDYLIELEKENRLKLLVYYYGEVKVVTNEITTFGTKINDKTRTRYLEAIFEPSNGELINKGFFPASYDKYTIFNFQYFTVHKLLNNPNFKSIFNNDDFYIDTDKRIFVKFDDGQVTKDDIRISSSELTNIIEGFSYHELQKEIEIYKEQINTLKAQQKNETDNEIKDSAYCLISVLKNLLLDPNINAYHFKTDDPKSTNQPTQDGLASYIDDMQIPSILGDNVKILLRDANKKLKDANSKARNKQTK